MCLSLLLCSAALYAASTKAMAATETASAGTAAGHGDVSSGRITVYRLPPQELERSRSLYFWRTWLDFASPAWDVLVLLAILNFHWAARLRDWTLSATHRKWLQGLIFLPAILLLLSIFDLPPAIIAHHVGLAYGQSIQHWPSWLLDWAKGILLDLIGGTFVLSVLYGIIRISRRWWLWFWLFSLPLQFLLVFILPVAVDPLFNHFEPLSKSDPALVQKLEQVVAKTGEKIPPSRMYLMRASSKVTGSNAYVTGFGASKRVVVWDTTIKSSPTDEILFVFGHELGHYVLNHILHGLLLSSAISFVFLWIGFHLANVMIKRYGIAWHIASFADWSSLPLLLLVLAILAFAAEPIGNGISRMQEHEADVFGQEVIHGIVGDPQKVAADSFQRLGEEYLEYPSPNPFVVFWSYSHPPTAARVAFAASYDPWQPGKHPRYFKENALPRRPS